mgnify:CR=1 FL=1
MNNSPEDNNRLRSTDHSEYGTIEPSGVVPEFLYDLFRDFHATGKSVDSETKPDPGPVRQGVRDGSRLFPYAAAIAAMLIATISGIQSFGVSRSLAIHNRRDEIQRPTEQEAKERLMPRFISDEQLAEVHKGTVSVTARNVQFPCFLQWTANNETKTITLPTGETTLSLPIDGPTTLFCRPFRTSCWLQPVEVWVAKDGKDLSCLGRLLGRSPLPLQDRDEVVVFFEDPVAPWNAVCVPIKGESVLVTLERPNAAYDADKWLAGQWDAQEEFPNTALFWARYGSAGLAKELAAYFVSQRTGTENWFVFRGNMHTSLVVQTNNAEDVSQAMQTISQEELEKELLKAFELLRRRMSPDGGTVDAEITLADEILLQLR